jgi:hypothetical protein
MKCTSCGFETPEGLKFCNECEAAGFVVQETTAILHNPRLMAVGTVALARKLGWPPVTRLIQRVLIAAQRLEQTRWRYYSGSFVAAKAVRRKPGQAAGNPDEQR